MGMPGTRALLDLLTWGRELERRTALQVGLRVGVGLVLRTERSRAALLHHASAVELRRAMGAEGRAGHGRLHESGVGWGSAEREECGGPCRKRARIPSYEPSGRAATYTSAVWPAQHTAQAPGYRWTRGPWWCVVSRCLGDDLMNRGRPGVRRGSRERRVLFFVVEGGTAGGRTRPHEGSCGKEGRRGARTETARRSGLATPLEIAETLFGLCLSRADFSVARDGNSPRSTPLGLGHG